LAPDGCSEKGSGCGTITDPTLTLCRLGRTSEWPSAFEMFCRNSALVTSLSSTPSIAIRSRRNPLPLARTSRTLHLREASSTAGNAARPASGRTRIYSFPNKLEHRMGFEPMNTGFADQRVSHFAIGAYFASNSNLSNDTLTASTYYACFTAVEANKTGRKLSRSKVGGKKKPTRLKGTGWASDVPRRSCLLRIAQPRPSQTAATAPAIRRSRVEDHRHNRKVEQN
jgi:hypothetical protein